MDSTRILVVGGAGYIGSHTTLELVERGYEPIVYDNMVYGHPEFVSSTPLIVGDIGDSALLDRIFSEYDIRAVMHFAAYAYVGESVVDPSKYYHNNVAKTLNLLEAMRRHRVWTFVFSSTCAVYGRPAVIPIPETNAIAPINPYGASKAMVERIVADYAKAYGFRFSILRYFNAAGADERGRVGEWHEPETHLIPLVLRAAGCSDVPVTVYGTDYDTPDGTCVRDYIHVTDLADAHILAMERLFEDGFSATYNLGTGMGTSVRQIIDAAESVTGLAVSLNLGPRRAGDPPMLVADPRLARKELGWVPTRSDIRSILATAWEWERRLRSRLRHSTASSLEAGV
jgi:UDP-glucose-4-epimerase GalE